MTSLGSMHRTSYARGSHRCLQVRQRVRMRSSHTTHVNICFTCVCIVKVFGYAIVEGAVADRYRAFRVSDSKILLRNTAIVITCMALG